MIGVALALVLSASATETVAIVPTQTVVVIGSDGLPPPAEVAEYVSEAVTGTSLQPMPYEKTESFTRARNDNRPSAACGLDVPCLTRIGRLAGARYQIVISLGRLDTNWGWQMLIVDLQAGAEVARGRGVLQAPRSPRGEMARALRKAIPAELTQPLGLVELAGGDGAQLYVDGKPAGQLPLERPLALSAGKHRLGVVRPDPRAAEVSLSAEVVAGAKIELVVPAAPSRSIVARAGAAGWTAAGLLVVATGAGVLGYVEDRRWQSGCQAGSSPCTVSGASVPESMTSAERIGTISNWVAYGALAGAVVAGTIAAVRIAGDDGPAVTLAPQLGDRTGLAVQVRF
jgi:hypothetical protein